MKVKLSRKVLYELDGGDRMKMKSFKVKVEPGAITVCVPVNAPLSQAQVSEHAPREKMKV